MITSIKEKVDINYSNIKKKSSIFYSKMKIKEIIGFLEQFAPPSYQESYDNSGLIVGDRNTKVTGALICLDSIECVIDEAIKKKCNLVIAHHPIVFKGLKRFNGKNYVERTVMKAIKNDIAIYAIHTNLDNVRKGVNARICERLGLQNLSILSPKRNLKKLSAFIPVELADVLKKELFEKNFGADGDRFRFSYATVGAGTNSGQAGPSIKLETIFPEDKKGQLMGILNKVLGDPAIYAAEISDIATSNLAVGSGMIGTLPKEIDTTKFLKSLKKSLGANCVKHTDIISKTVKKIAVCGGSGGFLLHTAIAKGADVFITADYKYHEFFDADGKIVIADIGHYESEQFTIDLLFEIISEKFTNFAVFKTAAITNPVNYL